MKGRLRRNAELGKYLAESYMAGEWGMDDRAVGNSARVAISLIVSLAVGALVAAFILPVGIAELVGVDTSNWSTGAQSMWSILDVAIVLAVMLFFFAVAISAADKV